MKSRKKKRLEAEELEQIKQIKALLQKYPNNETIKQIIKTC